MKPLLVVCPGYPKSGTTSLFASLMTERYAYGAIFKEGQYWRRILRPEEKNGRWDHYTMGFDTVEAYTAHILSRVRNYSKNPRPWLSVGDYADLIDRITNRIPVWQDYISLYKSVNHFPAVDFSLMNGILNSKELDIVKSELDDHFDLKILICLRDYDSWLTSCKTNRIGTPNAEPCKSYRSLVKLWSSKWPTMVARLDDFDNKDSVLSSALNEFMGINIPKSWKVGKFNITPSTITKRQGYGDDWSIHLDLQKDNKHYYETVKTGIV